jgi:hypothetical protein
VAHPERHRPSIDVRRIGDNGLVVSIKPPAHPLNLEPGNLDLLMVVSVDKTMLLPQAGPSHARSVPAGGGAALPTPLDVLRRTLRAVVDHLTPDDRLGLCCGAAAGAAAQQGPARLQFMNRGHKAWARQAVDDMAPAHDDIERLIGGFRPAFDQAPRVRPVRAVFFFTNRSFRNRSVGCLSGFGDELTRTATQKRR